MGSKTAPRQPRARGRPNVRTTAAPVSSPVAAQTAEPEAEQAKLLNPYDWTLLTAHWADGQWWLTKQDRQARSTPLQPVLDSLTQQGWHTAMEWQDADHRLLLLKREAGEELSLPAVPLAASQPTV